MNDQEWVVAPASEKPWQAPQAGDLCITAKGQMRQVDHVSAGYGRVVYYLTRRNEDRDWRSAECWITTWEDWCRRAVTGGGEYRRRSVPS